MIRECVANLRAALELARYINPDHDRLYWLQAIETGHRGARRR